MDSQDFSDEYSDISSVVSSDEISILSKDTDEEAEEIVATSLEPYQFEPIDANTSDTTDEDESSSDEEPVEKLPDDMSWYDYSTTTCQLIFQFLQVPLWKL